MSDLGFVVRKASPADVPFVTNSWLKSFRSNPHVAGIPNQVYYHQQHLILEKIVPQSMVLVACNELDPTQILGYLCAQIIHKNLVLHYFYTKGPFRRYGIATKLFDTALDLYSRMTDINEAPFYYYTHRSTLPKELLAKHHLVFNPYILCSDKPEIHAFELFDRDQGDRYAGYYPRGDRRREGQSDDERPVQIKPKL